MKRAQDIVPTDAEQERLQLFDLRELDAPDQHTHYALKYVGRLEAVLRAIQRRIPPGGLVVEVGCAQANVSLLLAERGYVTVGVDRVQGALEYALKKYERGSFYPVCGRAEALPLRDRVADAVFVGELLEHCSDPVGVLRHVARCVKPSGVMVVTTMNGEWFGSPDPTYSEVRGTKVAKPEFGRAGEDHLFAFTLPELRRVLEEAGLRVVRAERHATVLHSDRVMALKRMLSPPALRALSRWVCRLPVLGRLTGLTLLVVAVPDAKG